MRSTCVVSYCCRVRTFLSLLVEAGVPEGRHGHIVFAGLAACQHVHQRRLTGARGAHERQHHARLDVARHVVKQLQLVLLDALAHKDRVVEVAPRQVGPLVHRRVALALVP